jgi:hypothetical protein
MAATGLEPLIRAVTFASALAIGSALSLASPAGAVAPKHELFNAHVPPGAETFDPGPTGGLFTRKIRRAIMTFQNSRGLRVTGVIDKPTLRELRAIQPDWGKVPPPGATYYSAENPGANQQSASTAAPAAAAAVASDSSRPLQVSAPVRSLEKSGPVNPVGVVIRGVDLGISTDAFLALTAFLAFVLTLGLGAAAMLGSRHLMTMRQAKSAG